MAAQLAEREAERDAAEAARRELIAAVSHDLRTPLTSLRLLADAIEDDVVDSATRRRYIEQMSVHIASLSALIEDLFELSRLEAGDIQWSMQQVALDELVEETVEAMRPHAEQEPRSRSGRRRRRSRARRRPTRRSSSACSST